MSAPVYLYTGPEIGNRNDQVESIKSSLVKKFGDVDFYLQYASAVKLEEVISTLRAESLFIPATCVVLREAELIKKKEEIDLISSWLQSARETAVLILVSDEISVDSKLDKLVPKENKQIFWAMDESRLSVWLGKYLRDNGYAAEPDAIDLILDLTEPNTSALKMECNRFFLCFQKGHLITSDDVDAMLAHNREESAFTLFDAMAKPDESLSSRFSESLSILQKILLTKNNSPVMILSGLSSCFRRLELWHSIHAGGAYLDDFALKTKGFSSKTARTQYSRASRVWTFGQCAAILALISQTDSDIRSTGMGLQETQLYLLLYEIIMKGGARCAKYEPA
ncbi:MAG: DNA polymerase III subunit delta [Treponema sp.]|nr:DNA polymerase III subunit delta [Treponema sp.]